jgi:predicted lactoylglutathione lyase
MIQGGMLMLGYVTLGTNDLARSAAFYDALAKEMGAGRTMETEKFIAWGAPNSAMVFLIKPADGNSATVGNGVMAALVAKDAAQVDRLYEVAMSLGAKCEGPPGDRGGGFYAAYFRDLDGNKLNAFHHG